MKGRPRYAENAVANRLSLFSSTMGLDPIERVPVTGRRGPDLTINQLGLAVDVKSRKSVPKSIMAPPDGIVHMGGLIGIRLEDLYMGDEWVGYISVPMSKQVLAWYNNMDRWVAKQTPGLITVLALHRPGMNYDHTTIIMKNWSEFYDRTKRFSHSQPRPGELPYYGRSLGGFASFDTRRG